MAFFMNYITEIFERLNLQQIRAFLLNGVECKKISENSYKQRLKKSEETVIIAPPTKHCQILAVFLPSYFVVVLALRQQSRILRLVWR